VYGLVHRVGTLVFAVKSNINHRTQWFCQPPERLAPAQVLWIGTMLAL